MVTYILLMCICWFVTQYKHSKVCYITNVQSQDIGKGGRNNLKHLDKLPVQLYSTIF